MRVALGKTNLQVHPLCLGGNVFGWSATPAESQLVLDAYADAGGNFIDSADMYSQWHDGNIGGESETIIGDWMKSRGNRADIIVATKVAKLSTRAGLAAANIAAAAEDSLRRLGTEYIDIYYAHHDDESVPLEESLTAFHKLVTAGKVRYIAASNYSADRLAKALKISRELGISEYLLLQPHYNAIVRNEYEGALLALAVKEEIAVLPYFALAAGFLTGKYQPGVAVESVRAEDMPEYMNDRGWAILQALADIAAQHNAPIAATALAWLRAQPGIAAPIASARTPEQLSQLLPIVELSPEQIAQVNAL
ncbi:MAG: aldo/keto reductase [Candidatus Nanopelagicales bacterium]|jgi:aryl-alcohol dehydrogenase-like predicted oxidoreductase|nr:aldo/keto reductase [Candidatus Nanopelagicales bacterium]MDP4666784.1 aldo/keto reductase [Candidatus Nanopelagicales bacterium]MDP4895602.1 aldo/keto reductase [Candidatus Nanopelagicales bacterium]MDP5050495.1 aldo/keto reductase [Candidatus Nanopelagicales bacterium]